MSVKKLKPISNAQRFRVVNDFDMITASKPERSLLSPKKRTGGRNNKGRMTVRHIGRGHKRQYRIIDFKRDKYDTPGEIIISFCRTRCFLASSGISKLLS